MDGAQSHEFKEKGKKNKTPHPTFFFKSPVFSSLLELSFYVVSHMSFCCVGIKCAGLLSMVNIAHVIKECVYLNIFSFFPPAQRPAAWL